MLQGIRIMIFYTILKNNSLCNSVVLCGTLCNFKYIKEKLTQRSTEETNRVYLLT
jgi:hypothetical protein